MSVEKHNIVYHYCSLATFQNIISNKKIWLSDISYSNDSKELNWAVDYIKKEFIKTYDNDKAKYLKEKISKEKFEEISETYISDYFSIDDSEPSYHAFFVACFCNNGDLLSQWRGYGDDGRGVAIGFDKDLLSKICPDFMFNSDVIYSTSKGNQLIKKYAKAFISKLKMELKNTTDSDIIIKSMKVYNRFFFEIFKFSVLFKSDYFREEDEWRICFIYPKKEDTASKIVGNDFKHLDYKYHFSGGKLVTHHELDFSSEANNLIKEIVLGPKCSINESDMGVFLNSYGIDCDVEKSKGSYR